MTPLAAEIDALVRELAAEQLRPDDFWIPRLASILEQLADIEFQLRMKSVDVPRSVPDGGRSKSQSRTRDRSVRD